MSKSLKSKWKKRNDIADSNIQIITPPDYDNPAIAADVIAFDIHFYNNSDSLFCHLFIEHGMNEDQYLSGLRYLNAVSTPCTEEELNYLLSL